MWDAFLKQITAHTGMPAETAKVALTALGTAVLIVFILFACAARPAHAQQMSCQPQVVVTAMLSSHEGYASHHQLTGAEAAYAVEMYNAMPPQGNFTFDTVTLFMGRDGWGALVLFGNDGLYCGSLRFGDDAARRFKIKVLGQDA